MERDAFLGELRKEPFDPLTIKLTAGDLLRVRRPEFVALSPDGEMAVIFEEGSSYRVIDMQHIVSITPTKPRKSKKAS